MHVTIHRAAGDPRALDDCERLIALLLPSEVWPLSNAAWRHVRNGNRVKAITYYRAVLALKPDHAFARDQLRKLGVTT